MKQKAAGSLLLQFRALKSFFNNKIAMAATVQGGVMCRSLTNWSNVRKLITVSSIINTQKCHKRAIKASVLMKYIYIYTMWVPASLTAP